MSPYRPSDISKSKNAGKQGRKRHKFSVFVDDSVFRLMLYDYNLNFILGQRWRQGRNAGGTKTVRVPTASEASKIFTGHTFQIGLKCDYTLKKHNKQVTKVPTVHRNFSKIQVPTGGLSEFLGGSCPPSNPGRAIPA